MYKLLLSFRTILVLFTILIAIESCKKLDPDPVPKAEFTYDINSSMVFFSNKSVNHTSSSWDFGDGETSGSTSPSHNYTRNGSYQVTLTVKSSSAKDVIVKTISISGVTGSAIFYKKFSTGAGRNIDVYVDGSYRGSINGNYYYSASPGCGNQYSVTVTGLSEGNHNFTAKENTGLLPSSWSGTVSVTGGQCSSMGLTN